MPSQQWLDGQYLSFRQIASTMLDSGTAQSSGSSCQPTQNSCGQWVVDGTGTFANKKVFTFEGTSLPAGLTSSKYQVDDQSAGAPYNHCFDPSNVVVSDGFLNLKVPGGQEPTSDNAISCAEITTKFKIQYGSVRTNAIFSTVPGTCHGTSSHPSPLLPTNPTLLGNFFYHNDTQEIDIEYVSDNSSISNPGGQGKDLPPWLQYSNQANKPGGKATYASGDPPNDVTVVHEYRIDWTADKTRFFLDGILQKIFRPMGLEQLEQWRSCILCWPTSSGQCL
jgi:hypothetical protein